MTMPKAIALLIASSLIMAAGIGLVFLRIEQGRVDPGIQHRDVGARVGEERATPSGSSRSTFPIGPRVDPTEALASITAAIRTAQAALSPTPVPSVNVVAVGGTVEFEGSRYTVVQVADPEPPGFFRTKVGFRRIALEVRQEAVDRQVRYSFSNFKLRDTNGTDYTWAITNTEPKFETGTLEAGQSRQGWMSFEIPLGADPAALILNVFGLREGVTLVTLR